MEGGGGHKVIHLNEEPLATDNCLEREYWFSFRTWLSSSMENHTPILEYLGSKGSLQEQQAPMSHLPSLSLFSSVSIKQPLGGQNAFLFVADLST